MPHANARASAVTLKVAVVIAHIFALAAALPGCSSKEKGEAGPSPSATASSGLAAAGSGSAAPSSSPVASASAASAAPEPPKVVKKFTRVLHTGDSMVGGGLAWTLGPMVKADGAQYFREVVESGSIQEFSQNEKLPKWLAQYKPDIVFLSIGANHVPHFTEVNLDKELAPFVAKLEKRLEKYDCIWLAPPLWKPEKQAPFNVWLKEHVTHCKWYDGSHLDISRRVDHIHPDEAGGKVLAEDFWKFFKGEAPYEGKAPFYETGLGAPASASSGK